MKRLINFKMSMFIMIDTILINSSFITAFYFLSITPRLYYSIWNAVVIVLIHISSFYFFKLYKNLWTYASIDEFLLSIGGCVTGGVFSLIYLSFVRKDVPLSVYILGVIFNIFFIIMFRFSFRIYRRVIRIGTPNKVSFKRVIVVGAGSAGAMIINEMKNHPEMKYIPVGLIDDNKVKLGKIISGVKVVGGREKIRSIIQERQVGEIIIAMPSLMGKSRAELIKICTETGCKIKTLPAVHELISGKKTLNQIRDVDVADLLGREPIILDNEGISDYIKDKTVLITGGGGSIGSELCRQVIEFHPEQLLILDSYENNAYDIYNEINHKNKGLKVRVIIASVTDRKKMEEIFIEYRPSVIFHAAAHKHVPLMEGNPAEAIKNNVFGTLNVAMCASMVDAERFVMISTDKAVNPTNVMGASKRICEMIIQMMDATSRTEFVAVRFGNVLGSNGSVIPLFKKQIASGGPVTVTDESVTRYFMTVHEAVQLVLQAGVYAIGGEIFVLDMGKPIRIYDLACDLIKLSGLELNQDIMIEITGLRPGEKLYEELLMSEEGLLQTEHKKIYIGKPIHINVDRLNQVLSELKDLTEKRDREKLYKKIEELVPTYKRSGKDYDNTVAVDKYAKELVLTR